jgi:mono/diheme cytochrome c family protein
MALVWPPDCSTGRQGPHIQGRTLRAEEACVLKAFTIVVVIGASLVAQEIKRTTIQSGPVASAASGQAMFREYCAVCHGNGAKGDGPAANALKKRPADLTQLARKNNGKFPELEVRNYVSGRDTVAAHGSRDMPVWGQLFRSLEPHDNGIPDLRVKNLADYVKSLQTN